MIKVKKVSVSYIAICDIIVTVYSYGTKNYTIHVWLYCMHIHVWYVSCVYDMEQNMLTKD